jgi:biopolymer transport protein ExbD
MAEMNTTPLIDVMLVLLIMFIITVPTQSHRISMDLPQTPPVPVEWIRPLSNDLAMSDAGRLSWNGRPINDRQLRGLLSAIAKRSEQPEIHFRPDPAARYERVDEVLGIAATSGATGFGFAGNERFKDSF